MRRIVSLTLACCINAGLAGSIAMADDTPAFAVGPQYDTTHVYVSADDFDRFVASLLATFGGKASPEGVLTVTPVPSKTKSQLVLTPAGTFSVFGFITPIPYPFGSERTGYLVNDFDGAVRAAAADGADVLVAPFDDAIGRDVIVQWPGGVDMQLYWHTKAPSYPPLAAIPENRVYVAPTKTDEFVRDYLKFSHGTVIEDDAQAPGSEIGRPGHAFRRVRISSSFGVVTVLATNGFLPYPFGREVAGYGVSDLNATLARGRSAGVSVLTQPFSSDGRQAVIVEFPGGYIAEIHTTP